MPVIRPQYNYVVPMNLMHGIQMFGFAERPDGREVLIDLFRVVPDAETGVQALKGGETHTSMPCVNGVKQVLVP